MKIWVDADACPSVLKELIIKAAHRLQIDTVFVANKVIALPESPFLSSVLVKQGADIADKHIAENAVPGDLVVTQDILLAAALVAADIVAIDLRGNTFSESNIGDRVSTRNLMSDLRDTGEITGGPRPYSDKDKRLFASTFDRTITALRRRQS